MSHYENTVLQLHTLYAESVAFMSKHINSWPNKAEGTIFTVWVSALMTHFIIIYNLYICVWWTVCLNQVVTMNNTCHFSVSITMLPVWEHIFSKSHVTHMLLMWHMHAMVKL